MSAVVDSPSDAKPPAGPSDLIPSSTAAEVSAAAAGAGSTTGPSSGEQQTNNGDAPVPMRIEDVRSTAKAQRIAAHSHIKGLGLNSN
eukprot:IDg9800t1